MPLPDETSRTMHRDSADGFDLLEATVRDIHAGIRDGDVTVRELVERYLARIEEYDDRLNAVLTTNSEARQRAAELDEHYRTAGFVGPLHGVPVILKDNHDTQDMPTTAGAQALAGMRPDRDATVVERIRGAGAVVLGKANLQELSFGVDTISSLGGETRNAYDLDRRPSGSSGGTAAAIAANLGAIGTGSDTCSSVRSPPAFNNLVGVRPSRGLVSRRGIIPLSETQDTVGPITRTVADAARLLEVMAGYDPADPVTARGSGRVPEGGYVSGLETEGLAGARIGVVREFFGLQDPDSASETAAARVTTVIEDALTALDDAGATVIDPVEVIDTKDLMAARVLEYEWARDFDRYLAEIGDAAPLGSLAELVSTGTVAPSVAERIEASDILEVDRPMNTTAYLRALSRREEIREDTVGRMIDHELDALVYPPSTIPPVEIPEHQPFAELPCELAAHTGLPAIVVPAGFTDDGLPVGLEFLGRAFTEPRLFELAYAFEQATRHRRQPTGFGPVA